MLLGFFLSAFLTNTPTARWIAQKAGLQESCIRHLQTPYPSQERFSAKWEAVSKNRKKHAAGNRAGSM